MLKQLKQRKSGGFTIIEVMIVLAIAALILLIVLLAVPALQRNSRNTTIKNDVATVAGGMNTYTSDNNGINPTSVVGTGSVVISTGKADKNPETISVNGSTAVTTVGTSPTKPIPAGTIQVVVGVDCSGNASARASALFYSNETSSGTTLQCVSN
jgi:prepilin-type N-terminal cleavage/methylation domain-containing protein